MFKSNKLMQAFWIKDHLLVQDRAITYKNFDKIKIQYVFSETHC